MSMMSMVEIVLCALFVTGSGCCLGGLALQNFSERSWLCRVGSVMFQVSIVLMCCGIGLFVAWLAKNF